MGAPRQPRGSSCARQVPSRCQETSSSRARRHKQHLVRPVRCCTQQHGPQIGVTPQSSQVPALGPMMYRLPDIVAIERRGTRWKPGRNGDIAASGSRAGVTEVTTCPHSQWQHAQRVTSCDLADSTGPPGGMGTSEV